MDFKRKKLLISFVIFSVFYIGLTRADPEPVPEPDPEPESLPESNPDPEADAQYYARKEGGFNQYYDPNNVSPCIGGNCLQASAPCMGGNCLSAVVQEMPIAQSVPAVPAVQSSNSVCGMTDKCCGMATQDCCLAGEQKCYTVYDRICDGQTSKPVCTVRKSRDCHTVQDRTCRRVPDKVFRDFEAIQCSQVPVKKCLNFERKVCKKKANTKIEKVTWSNEKLVTSNIQQQHCINQTKVNCSPKTESRMVPRRVQKQMPIVKSQKKCSQIPNKQPDRTVSIPVTKVVYRTMCYNVPRTSCAKNPCNVAAPCAQGSSVCSASETQTKSVCPQPVAGGYPVGGVGVDGGAMATAPVTGCQQVQQPVCTDATICQASAQQCCQVKVEQVCRQVPQRVTEMATQIIPGQVTYSENCVDTPYTTYEPYYETVNEEIKTTVDDCQTSVDPQCHNYNSPTFEVENVDQTENVQIQIDECEIATFKEEKCHTYYDANCTTKMVRKQLNYQKTVCDQIVNRQLCIDIPLTDCSVAQTTSCRMQAREVCQDTCSKSQLCNDCDQFRNGPGFGSCGNSTCGTFLPKDPYTLGSNGQPIMGGEGIYTGGQGSFDGVVNIGGEGYYPGTVGGEGYFPGTVGVEGYYPGTVGGEGYYSGTVGGEMYYPGTVGGSGFYSGAVGGEEYYPGKSTCTGSECREGEAVGRENYYPGTSCVGSVCDGNGWDNALIPSVDNNRQPWNDGLAPPINDNRQPWDDGLTPPGGIPKYNFNAGPPYPW